MSRKWRRLNGASNCLRELHWKPTYVLAVTESTKTAE